jgi:hypothetical protein
VAAYTTVTVVGGNLFQIALTQLGDARQAVRIAQANNLTDFFLDGSAPVTLQIPPRNSDTSGVAQQ